MTILNQAYNDARETVFKYKTVIKEIEAHPVYLDVLCDSSGGLMYDVADRDKYDTTEILALWASMEAYEQEDAGGIMKGAFDFLTEKL